MLRSFSDRIGAMQCQSNGKHCGGLGGYRPKIEKKEKIRKTQKLGK